MTMCTALLLFSRRCDGVRACAQTGTFAGFCTRLMKLFGNDCTSQLVSKCCFNVGHDLFLWDVTVWPGAAYVLVVNCEILSLTHFSCTFAFIFMLIFVIEYCRMLYAYHGVCIVKQCGKWGVYTAKISAQLYELIWCMQRQSSRGQLQPVIFISYYIKFAYNVKWRVSLHRSDLILKTFRAAPWKTLRSTPFT